MKIKIKANTRINCVVSNIHEAVPRDLVVDAIDLKPKALYLFALNGLPFTVKRGEVVQTPKASILVNSVVSVGYGYCNRLRRVSHVGDINGKPCYTTKDLVGGAQETIPEHPDGQYILPVVEVRVGDNGCIGWPLFNVGESATHYGDRHFGPPIGDWSNVAEAEDVLRVLGWCPVFFDVTFGSFGGTGRYQFQYSQQAGTFAQSRQLVPSHEWR